MASKHDSGPTLNADSSHLTEGFFDLIHPKAMPVILRSQEEADRRLEADTRDALALQRPLPDDALRIVAKGEKEDTTLRADRPSSSQVRERATNVAKRLSPRTVTGEGRVSKRQDE